MYKKSIFNLFLFLMLSCGHMYAQSTDTIGGYDGVVRVIYLDSLVVSAKQQGFSTEEFIRLVQEDKTFYQAFRNLHFVNYEAANEMFFFSKPTSGIAPTR